MDDLVQPQGEDGPVWDQFADDCMDWLFKHCGKDSAQYLAGCAIMSDRAAAYDALARKDAEIAELRQRAERAEARVREAPVAVPFRNTDYDAALFATVLYEWVGKRVALVLLDTDD